MAKKAVKHPKKKSKTFSALLEADHKKVKSLFKQFEKTEDEDEKRELVQSVIKELEIHTQIEEEILYPAMREVKELEEEGLVDESYVEHDVAKRLMEELSGMEPGDEQYDAKVSVLSEIINHHVEEEEEEIFPKAEKNLDSAGIAEQLAQRKEELLGGAQKRKAA